MPGNPDQVAAELAARRMNVGSQAAVRWVVWIITDVQTARVPADTQIMRFSSTGAGAGFVRLNIACPRSLLAEALDRLAQAVGKIRPSLA